MWASAIASRDTEMTTHDWVAIGFLFCAVSCALIAMHYESRK